VAPVCLGFFAVALIRSGAQTSTEGNPHLSGRVVAPQGANEVAFCDKCHTTGCPMPHPEHVPVNWPINGRVNLANGQVTCSSCHTPGFRHRTDAFLARDQKGLCATCHNGTHVLPNAHPFGTPCESCHSAPRASLTASSPTTTDMVATIDAECLRCHYDGPITHPIGVPNTKKAASDLPLSKDDGHSNEDRNGQLLRKNNHRGALCLTCHDDL
jgi:predicted CXXCH cytochrome family protein